MDQYQFILDQCKYLSVHLDQKLDWNHLQNCLQEGTEQAEPPKKV